MTKFFQDTGREIDKFFHAQEKVKRLEKELQNLKKLERERGEERKKEKAREIERQKKTQTEIQNLKSKLQLLEKEREGERAQTARQAQTDREKLKNLESELQKLRISEKGKEEERKKEREKEVERQKRSQAETEKLTGVVYQLLTSNLLQPSMTKTLPESLQDTDSAQTVIDFLNDVLSRSDLLQPGQRKRVLHLLCKIAKSAQVFPKSTELTGVECDFGQIVNEGGFGVIYKGKFAEETVCIKAVRMYQVGANKHALRAHASELVLGAHTMHPNILPFYGAFISREDSPRICIASPWMERGNLVEYLFEYTNTPRIPLLSDILSGLHHLHEMEIVHADLKANNVLISGTGRAMLADFGGSRIAMTNAGNTTATGVAGTLHWMAPELFTAENLPATPESDIWAFGCICYEVLTGKIPFEEYKPYQLIGAFVRGDIMTLRPDPPLSISYADEIWTLAEKCLRCDPSKRLTADEAEKFILDLNVNDERPPASVDLVIKRPRFTSEIDYNTLVSIIQQVGQNR